jgi:hypothetical protein
MEQLQEGQVPRQRLYYETSNIDFDKKTRFFYSVADKCFDKCIMTKLITVKDLTKPEKICT